MTERPLQSISRQICNRLRSEAEQLGISLDARALRFEELQFDRVTDNASGEGNIRGCWRSADGSKLGELQFHSDGSFYAEYDLLTPHPQDRRWFIEGVSVWGNDREMKSEPKLLPNPG